MWKQRTQLSSCIVESGHNRSSRVESRRWLCDDEWIFDNHFRFNSFTLELRSESTLPKRCRFSVIISPRITASSSHIQSIRARHGATKMSSRADEIARDAREIARQLEWTDDYSGGLFRGWFGLVSNRVTGRRRLRGRHWIETNLRSVLWRLMNLFIVQIHIRSSRRLTGVVRLFVNRWRLCFHSKERRIAHPCCKGSVSRCYTV